MRQETAVETRVGAVRAPAYCAAALCSIMVISGMFFLSRTHRSTAVPMKPSLTFPELLVPSTRGACLAMAAAAATLVGLIAGPAGAAKSSAKSIEIVQSRPAGQPIMAIVSLSKQHVTIYDANGWIRARPCFQRAKGLRDPCRDLHGRPEGGGALLQSLRGWVYAVHAANHLVGDRAPWRPAAR